GGSDAHIVSAIGTCMTSFEKEIENESDLVQELRNGRFTAVRLES
ncbi:MAG TPA: metal-dependent phosphoesterase, partial [Phycisphaerales bacterium]|nr:metal-dependent phosphoesterase [Phycisphaerales bacterium]